MTDMLIGVWRSAARETIMARNHEGIFIPATPSRATATFVDLAEACGDAAAVAVVEQFKAFVENADPIPPSVGWQILEHCNRILEDMK